MCISVWKRVDLYVLFFFAATFKHFNIGQRTNRPEKTQQIVVKKGTEFKENEKFNERNSYKTWKYFAEAGEIANQICCGKAFFNIVTCTHTTHT